MRKGQISMNTIVYVAISLLVLVLIVSVTTGSFGDLAGQFKDVTPDKLESVRTKCTTMCNTAKTAVVSVGSTSYANAQYCSSTFNIDIDGSGVIDPDENVRCWESPINIGCQATANTATGEDIILSPQIDC